MEVTFILTRMNANEIQLKTLVVLQTKNTNR